MTKSLSRRRTSRVADRRSPRPSPAPLFIERLEDRVVLSAIDTITYNQITSLGSGSVLDYNADPLLDADGNRAVFGLSSGAAYVVNSDGSGLTEVDPSHDDGLDISADGSVVIDTVFHGSGGGEIRVVNADGTDLHDAFTTNEGDTFARLSADGKTVYFTDNEPFAISKSQNDQPGLYSVPAAGGLPSLIVSSTQVAALLGVSVNQIGYDTDLTTGVSSDGTRMVFAASTGFDSSQFLVGVDGDGSDLHAIGTGTSPNGEIYAAGISGDGSKVFVADNSPELTAYNFDGSGKVVLSNSSTGGNGPERVQMSQDGSKLLYGTSGLLYNTDGSGVIQMGTDVGLNTSSAPHYGMVGTGLFRGTMNGAANEFLYIGSDLNDVDQLVIVQLDPSSLGVDPTISDVTIDPSYVLMHQQSYLAVGAAISASSTPVGASESVLLGGVSEFGDPADARLYDDGTHGDATTGDGTYTNAYVTYAGAGPTGPRTVRISAETVDAAGLQHVTSVEVGGLSLVSQAPAPSLQFDASTYSAQENAGSTTITVMRTVNTSGTVTVEYATSDGSAHSGTDYTTTSGELTFGAGVTSQTFTVPILDVATGTGSETVNLTLSDATGGATLGSPSTAVLTIQDHNPATVQFSATTFTAKITGGSAQVVVNRSGDMAAIATVVLSSPGGTEVAPFSQTVTLGAGAASTTVSIHLKNDEKLGESNETIPLALSSPGTGVTLGTATSASLIVQDDNTATVQFSAATFSAQITDGSAEVVVNRSGDMVPSVTVTLSSPGGAEVAPFGQTVTLGAGAASATVPIPLKNDEKLGESDETIPLTLSSPGTGVSLGAATSASLVIQDGNAASVQFSAATFTAGVAGGQAQVVVSRSGDTAAIATVVLSSPGGAEVAPFSQTVTLGAGATSVIVPILLKDDGKPGEGSVSIPLMLSAPGAGVSLGAATSATLVIQDNNPYPAPIQIASLTMRTVGFKTGTGRKARFKKETEINLQFTGAINGAGNLGAYHLLSGKTKRHVTTYTKKVPLASVSYNSTTDVATLVLAGTPDLSLPEELTVTASLLTDAFGRPLDGDDDGVPGGDYVATFGRGGGPMD